MKHPSHDQSRSSIKFEVTHRDCTARVGELKFGDVQSHVPAVLWYVSSRIPPPQFSELTLGETLNKCGTFFFPQPCNDLCVPSALIYPRSFPDELHHESYRLSSPFFGDIAIASAAWPCQHALMYVMANAQELFQNPRAFVSAIVSIRDKTEYRPLYVPGIATPANLALLIYCGVDLVDSLQIVRGTRNHRYFTPYGTFSFEELNEYPCRCATCSTGISGFTDLLSHNYAVMQEMLLTVRQAIRCRSLRDLVEASLHTDTRIASCLRLLDTEQYVFQEQRFPQTGPNLRVSPFSLQRPDIRRFRERIINRYEKPQCASILLLLPCSAKKPYSSSKSHRLFADILAPIKNRHAIHEVIVTSPLGLVPRELEYTYPASHYDISVTGHWERDEVAMMQQMMTDYLLRNRYNVVINHMPQDLPLPVPDNAIYTCIDHPTSDSSLSSLRDAVICADSYPKVSSSVRRYDTVRSMLLFQFGNEVDTFFKECTVNGKYPAFKLFHRDAQCATFVPQRGLFSLTLAGSGLLGTHYWVDIDDFVPKGSIFSVGVRDADSSIRTDDEVAVYFNDELRGVGVAEMNGHEMVVSNSGVAVRLRHHL